MPTGIEARGDKDFRDWLYFATNGGRCFVGFIEAYFDESARPPQIVVAGFAFTREKAEQFQARWSELFKNYPRGLHMFHLYNRKGDFADVSDQEADRLLDGAAEIIHDTAEMGVAVASNDEDAKAVGIDEDGYRTAYGICCRFVALRVVTWLDANGRSEKVNYTFEAGHKDQQEAAGFFQAIADDDDLVRKWRYYGHGFVRKGEEKSIFAQAADFLVWESRRFKVEQHDRWEDPTRSPVRQSFAKLILGYGDRYLFHFLTLPMLLKERDAFVRDGMLTPRNQERGE